MLLHSILLKELRVVKKILFLLMSMFVMLFPTMNSVATVFAEEEITDVLTDLSKDTNFSEADYPSGEETTIKVIQIAETSSSELLIYTYQPSNGTKNLFASSISISLSTSHTSLDYKIYPLKFLNKNGVFNKYIVNDLKCSDNLVRYYDISTIYRPYDSTIDEEPQGDNTISEVGLEVGQVWCASTTGDGVVYNKVESNVVTITSKWNGFIRYKKAIQVYPGFYASGKTDSHFVAFSTDKKIDYLEEVQMSYVSQKVYWQVSGSFGTGETSYGEKEEHNGVVIKASEVVESEKGFGASTYKWNRIQTKDDFLGTDGDSLTDESKNNLKDKQFVLRFLETSYSQTAGQNYSSITSTNVTDVVILRLKFKTDGVSYNLGVVDTKQSGSTTPAGEDKGGLRLEDILEMLKTIMMILLFIPLVMLLSPVLSAVLPVIGKLLLTAFKGAIYIITLPFKLLFGGKKDE